MCTKINSENWADSVAGVGSARFGAKSMATMILPLCFSSCSFAQRMMILLLLFLQKQSLAFAVYLFGIGTLLTGPGLKKTHVIMLSP
jgi:hypothetical protein